MYLCSRTGGCIIRATLLALTALPPGLFLFVAPGSAQDAPRDPLGGHRHFIFANTYHTTDARGKEDDYLVLGHYDFLDSQNLVVSYFQYDGNQDTRPIATAVRHPRLTTSSAQPGPVYLPGYVAFQRFRATWAANDRLLRVRIGRVIHEWALEDRSAGAYVMSAPYEDAETRSPMIGGQTYSNCVGFGYLSDRVQLRRTLSRQDLMPYYNGDAYSRQENGPGYRWVRHKEDMNVGLHRPFGAGDVLSYAFTDSSQKPPMQVQYTLLLNAVPYTHLLLYYNGSHDFNRNGVFDELGHTMQLLGAMRDGKITRMVFAEYSYQDNRRPIMEVGRFFARPPKR
jgi:hypothetical protein